MKYIGKMTKFIVPAKFSSCLMCTDSSRPSEPSISAPPTAASSTIGVCGPEHRQRGAQQRGHDHEGRGLRQRQHRGGAVSLANRIHGRGSGAVSSSRIRPISRS